MSLQPPLRDEEMLNLTLEDVQSLYSVTVRIEGKTKNPYPKIMPKVMCINDGVYDLTEFWEKHPGGSSILEEWRLRDATQPFDDIGHSDAAISELKKYKIANFVTEHPLKKKKECGEWCENIKSVVFVASLCVGFIVKISNIY